MLNHFTFQAISFYAGLFLSLALALAALRPAMLLRVSAQ